MKGHPGPGRPCPLRLDDGAGMSASAALGNMVKELNGGGGIPTNPFEHFNGSTQALSAHDIAHIVAVRCIGRFATFTDRADPLL